jgi:hypothetical protein
MKSSKWRSGAPRQLWSAFRLKTPSSAGSRQPPMALSSHGRLVGRGRRSRWRLSSHGRLVGRGRRSRWRLSGHGRVLVRGRRAGPVSVATFQPRTTSEVRRPGFGSTCYMTWRSLTRWRLTTLGHFIRGPPSGSAKVSTSPTSAGLRRLGCAVHFVLVGLTTG